MRCKYCGSESIHPDKNHQNFSAKKAIIGTVLVGDVGALAGLTGKDIDGYRCNECGQFMTEPMSSMQEAAILNAIAEAEKGDTTAYDYYKRQFNNIRANVKEKSSGSVYTAPSYTKESDSEKNTSRIKRIFSPNVWIEECPVFIDKVIIESTNEGDVLRLKGFNQTDKVIRSVYLDLTVFDDTGDKINDSKAVYQGINIGPGEELPYETKFKLNTDYAYGINIVVDKVAFGNDEVFRSDENLTMHEISERIEITKEAFKTFNYVKTALNGICDLDYLKDRKLYIPAKNNDCWQCVCGRFNKEEKCPSCGATYDRLNSALNPENLNKIKVSGVIEKAKRNLEKLLAEKDKAENKANEIEYKKALDLMNSNKIESINKAIEVFSSIVTYKDSHEKIDECEKLKSDIWEKEREDTYTKAEQLFSSKIKPNLLEAIDCYSRASDLYDSQSKIEECRRLIKR